MNDLVLCLINKESFDPSVNLIIWNQTYRTTVSFTADFNIYLSLEPNVCSRKVAFSPPELKNEQVQHIASKKKKQKTVMIPIVKATVMSIKYIYKTVQREE